MSRKYLNDRWCIRCGRSTATPYLRQYAKLFPSKGRVLDIGCGNGRNTRFMEGLGYKVDPVDMAAKISRLLKDTKLARILANRGYNKLKQFKQFKQNVFLKKIHGIISLLNQEPQA